MLDRAAELVVATLLSCPVVVYTGAAVLVVLLAAAVGWPWALLLLGTGNVAVAVWWVVHLLVTRRPW
jgi:hypothetical protein